MAGGELVAVPIFLLCKPEQLAHKRRLTQPLVQARHLADMVGHEANGPTNGLVRNGKAAWRLGRQLLITEGLEPRYQGGGRVLPYREHLVHERVLAGIPNSGTSSEQATPGDLVGQLSSARHARADTAVRPDR